MPVGTLTHDFIVSLKLIDDILEIPWEGEHIGMLVLVEGLIGTNSLLHGFYTGVLTFRLFHFWGLNRSSIEMSVLGWGHWGLSESLSGSHHGSLLSNWSHDFRKHLYIQ